MFFDAAASGAALPSDVCKIWHNAPSHTLAVVVLRVVDTVRPEKVSVPGINRRSGRETLWWGGGGDNARRYTEPVTESLYTNY